MEEDDLKNCFAMFAMLGWAMNGDFHEDEIPHKAWRLADNMMKARQINEPNVGIVAVKPKPRRRSNYE